MVYPVVVLVRAILAVIGMLLFVVSIFEDMSDSLGGDLPSSIKILVTLSEAMGWAIIPLVILMVIGFVLSLPRGARVRRPAAAEDASFWAAVQEGRNYAVYA